MSKELDLTKAINDLGFSIQEVANMIAAGKRGEMLITRAIILTAAYCARRAQDNWLIMQGLAPEHLTEFFLEPISEEDSEEQDNENSRP